MKQTEALTHACYSLGAGIAVAALPSASPIDLHHPFGAEQSFNSDLDGGWGVEQAWLWDVDRLLGS